MPTRVEDLRFPLLGLDQQYGYQIQPPHTTPDAQNVRPRDAIEGRSRGGSRPGMVKSYSDVLPDSPQCLASVTYVNSDDENESMLVAVADGQFYRSTSDGSFVVMNGLLETEAGEEIETEDGDTIATGGGKASTTQKIRAAERGQKLYFADHGTVTCSGDDGYIQNDDELVAPIDWTAYDIDVDRDMVEITAATGSSVETGVYKMASVTTQKITLDSATLTAGQCSYSIAPGLKELDPVTEQVVLVEASEGATPPNCPLVCRYRDRLVLAGPDHIWYMSRQGDGDGATSTFAKDWDYGTDPNDPQKAIAGTNANAGRVGEPITALIHHSDDYMIFGCENSVWMLRGDPAFGGQLDCLSTEVGVVNGDAWCKLPDSSTLFLSRSGLFYIPQGMNPYPQRFSTQPLPRELLDVDSSSYISMAYDAREDGIHLSITPSDGSTGDHWWIDWENKSFWPVAYFDDDHQPVTMCTYSATSSDMRYTRLGCYDGYIRQFDVDIGDDDGERIESYVLLGPYRLAGDGYRDGMISEILATLDAESGDVAWGVTVADTASGAVNGSDEPTAYGTWVAGRSNVTHPRVRGGAATVKLSYSGTTRWAMENVTATVRDLGRQRV